MRTSSDGVVLNLTPAATVVYPAAQAQQRQRAMWGFGKAKPLPSEAEGSIESNGTLVGEVTKGRFNDPATTSIRQSWFNSSDLGWTSDKAATREVAAVFKSCDCARGVSCTVYLVCVQWAFSQQTYSRFTLRRPLKHSVRYVGDHGGLHVT